MHLLAERTVKIRQPAATVFQYVANLERFGDWFPGVVAIESANTLGHGEVGKEYLETVNLPLQGARKVKLVVREAQTDKLLVTEGKLFPLMPRMEVHIQTNASGDCDLTWRMFSRNSNPLFRLTLLPLARGVVRKRAAIGLKTLKNNLESGKQPG